MKTILNIFFGWPNGGVWSNLIASLIWAIPGIIHLKKHQTKLYNKREENDRKRHEKLMAHIITVVKDDSSSQ